MAFTISSTFESLEDRSFHAQDNRITADYCDTSMGTNPSPAYAVIIRFRQSGYKLDRFTCYGASISHNFTRDICECKRVSGMQVTAF